ncbi:MAG TPA: biotin/lipoyl-containing protein [Kofleriaceae bacterium]|nr:biotin/lipoyl-containing protein [Kofleriaceae bacterium]
MTRSSRLHGPAVDALVTPPSDGATAFALRAPSNGVFVPAIAADALVLPDSVLGELWLLGRATAIKVPRTVSGLAVELVTTASAPVGFGDVLARVDPSLARAGGAASAATTAAASDASGLVFRAPTSGRFYSRSAPDKPAFVAEGTALVAGATICLLEVMKTFHRVTYGGAGLPDTARVVRVLVADGDDVNAGDPLLALE